MVISGPDRVSWSGDAGWTERFDKALKYWLTQNPQKMLIHIDSRTVAMEVGIR